MSLQDIQAALNEMAAQHASKVEALYQRNHLSAQDHEMFSRIAKRIDDEATNWEERVIMVKREVRKDDTMLGMPLQDKANRRAEVPKTRRKPTVLANHQVGELERLHSLLNHLANPDR
jgi:predicted transcriptional regulator